MYISRSNDTIQGRFGACRWRRSSLSISALPNSPLSHQAVLQLDTGGLETMQGGGSIDAAHPIELNSNNSRYRWDVVLYMHKWTDWRNSHSWRLQLFIKLSKRMHYVRVSPELMWDNHAVPLWTALIEFSFSISDLYVRHHIKVSNGKTLFTDAFVLDPYWLISQLKAYSIGGIKKLKHLDK